MRISDWSSDVCSSDLRAAQARRRFMAKREQAKHKIDRRLGVNLWGRPKSPLNNREYGPGQHGQRRRKPSDYGIQRMAKQKLKGSYGNNGEKQVRKYYAEANLRCGQTVATLIGLLAPHLPQGTRGEQH